jgi:type II secretory pathway component PulL
LLPILETQEKNQFRGIVTGDKSWFTLEFQHSVKWSRSRDEVRQWVKQTIGTRKLILTVLWGLDGFHVVDLMPGWHSFNSEDFLENIMQEILRVVFPDG